MNPQDVMEQYQARINSHRFEDVQPLISDTASFWFTDGTHRGIAEIRTAFEDTWSRFHKEVYWLEDIEWIARGDRAASCTYSFRWKAELDGKTIEGGGRGTTVLRKESEQWLIAHEHLSGWPR